MLSPLIYIFAVFTIIAVSSGPGGRYVRYYALVLLAVDCLSLLAYASLPGGRALTPVAFALDSVILGAALWLYRRHRTLWVGLQVGVQSVTTAIDLVHYGFMPEGSWGPLWWAQWWTINVLVYLQLAILAGAVVRRWYGPPYPLPRPNPARAAPDGPEYAPKPERHTA